MSDDRIDVRVQEVEEPFDVAAVLLRGCGDDLGEAECLRGFYFLHLGSHNSLLEEEVLGVES